MRFFPYFRFIGPLLGGVIPSIAITAAADTVTITGDTVFVTPNDCTSLFRYHASPDVAYRPGQDVHGKYVAPADVAGNDYRDLVPANGAKFTVQINPMNYTKLNGTQRQAAIGGGETGSTANNASPSAPSGNKYANTAMPVAHVEVDLQTGEVSVNGRKLTSDQERILAEACHKAGYR